MAPPALAGSDRAGMLAMYCPAWGSGCGDDVLATVPDLSIPGMARIPDMSWAAALGFATGAPRFAEVGLAAGLAAVLRLTGVAGLAAGFFFGGALAAGTLMPGIFCID